jgi:hypothetical protein
VIPPPAGGLAGIVALPAAATAARDGLPVAATLTGLPTATATATSVTVPTGVMGTGQQPTAGAAAWMAWHRAGISNGATPVRPRTRRR